MTDKQQCWWLLPLLFLLHTSNAKKLPSFIRACSRNDPDLNACALRNGRLAIPKLVEGIPSYRVPPIDPLRITEIKIDDPSGTGRQVSLNLHMQDIDVIGLRDSHLEEINIDLDHNVLWWRCSVPSVSMVGKYNTTGRVLVLPLTGSGNINITLDDLEFKYTLHFTREKRKDALEYANISDSNLSFNVKRRVYMDLENLFNGDKALSDNTNVFLNENWREMVQELGPPIAEALNAAVTQIVRNLIRSVPYSNIFPDNNEPNE